MFKATDSDFQNDAETLFNLPKKAVIVSVDETGKKVINGNHKGTNWTLEEAQKKIVNKYSKTPAPTRTPHPSTYGLIYYYYYYY